MICLRTTLKGKGQRKETGTIHNERSAQKGSLNGDGGKRILRNDRESGRKNKVRKPVRIQSKKMRKRLLAAEGGKKGGSRT